MTEADFPGRIRTELSDKEAADKTRKEDINYYMWSDRIWPPGLAPPSFNKALCQVLARIPEDEFQEICESVWFIVYNPDILAANVPFEQIYPSHSDVWKVKFYTIVIYHEALDFPHSALMGLLVHELAHCFVRERDYFADEEATDALVELWGFKDELKALSEHKAHKAAQVLSASSSEVPEK